MPNHLHANLADRLCHRNRCGGVGLCTLLAVSLIKSDSTNASVHSSGRAALLILSSDILANSRSLAIDFTMWLFQVAPFGKARTEWCNLGNYWQANVSGEESWAPSQHCLVGGRPTQIGGDREGPWARASSNKQRQCRLCSG